MSRQTQSWQIKDYVAKGAMLRAARRPGTSVNFTNSRLLGQLGNGPQLATIWYFILRVQFSTPRSLPQTILAGYQPNERYEIASYGRRASVGDAEIGSTRNDELAWASAARSRATLRRSDRSGIG